MQAFIKKTGLFRDKNASRRQNHFFSQNLFFTEKKDFYWPKLKLCGSLWVLYVGEIHTMVVK